MSGGRSDLWEVLEARVEKLEGGFSTLLRDLARARYPDPQVQGPGFDLRQLLFDARVDGRRWEEMAVKVRGAKKAERERILKLVDTVTAVDDLDAGVSYWRMSPEKFKKLIENEP